MDKLKKITGKKLWTGFVIIGLLLPYLQALFTGLPNILRLEGKINDG